MTISRNKREGRYAVRKGFQYVMIQLPNGMLIGDTITVFRKMGLFK